MNGLRGKIRGGHLGHGRLRYAKPRGDLDLASFVAVVDQVGNEFNIVLCQRAVSSRAGLPKTFRMYVGVWQRFALLDESSGVSRQGQSPQTKWLARIALKAC